MLRGNLSWPRPRTQNPLLCVVRAAWTLPTNLVGHLIGLVVSGALPRMVQGPAASGYVYPIRPGIGLDWVGAITLGHAILHTEGMFDGLAGRIVLAHELAHTRQHDRLGPLYLPLHALAQTISTFLSFIWREPVFSRVHAYNPLEQTFICLGASAYGELARGERMSAGELERFLGQFGV